MNCSIYDEGKVGFVDVQVNLRDINNQLNQSTQFWQSDYSENVTKHAPEGKLVVTLEAEDNDDPLENGNAKIKYSIEKNAIEEGTGLPIFEIHPTSGEIRTVISCFDREKTTGYSIHVVKTDGETLSGSSSVTIIRYDSVSPDNSV